ncbi:restriction endonuclease [Mobiluncus mulieris]|uniref:Mrr-like domain-containing protein n=1 Tax=Mobiluncus mulieris TaxID=2052 RepID=A0ABD4TZR4_9ACTO|nr:hypothetical protein [Mobiluncus mulieris]MCU9969889.1 hypothetical protein [Mobiluncus mulieris]MCU9972521.1 hypothetical protein [Mobiluncus mulieris]MCV0009970.1 hypothetical protein [Mobiluncus mulieris]NMW75702.1 hypothetical protein [Mobiluncus mulieris]NMX01898.1 hypothetical protein [Mobiluncus mulieris]
MAVQCKFYQPQTKIQKEHLDSFLSESGKEPFKRRIFVETAGVARSQTVGFNPTGTHHADRRPTRCQPGSLPSRAGEPGCFGKIELLPMKS